MIVAFILIFSMIFNIDIKFSNNNGAKVKMFANASLDGKWIDLQAERFVTCKIIVL